MSAGAESVLQTLIDAAGEANANARARAQAFGNLTAVTPEVASVSYTSGGQVLIIGSAETAPAAAAPLADQSGLHCILLITDSDQLPGTVNAIKGLHAVHGQLQSLAGYLGEFITVTGSELLGKALQLALPADKAGFDLVLDLSDTPFITSAIPPPGYYRAPRGDSEALKEAWEEIPALVGEFEKPRYFLYNAAICAHGRSGIEGCNRCIETCPTDAITTNGDVIQVNPNLCQGAGSCATACPTGAITYGYPPVADTLKYWRSLLKAYLQAGGEAPVLLVYDADVGRTIVERIAAGLGDNVLPVEVEELGSVGLDAWLAALAWGAVAVKLLVTPEVAPSVRSEVEFQIQVAQAVLEGLGYSAGQLGLVSEADVAASTAATNGLRCAAAGFAAIDEKRTLIRLAADHLVTQSPNAPAVVALPEGAPFGEISVDAQRCTLCMACVSQCPANALSAGDDSPQVRFVEARCVQCGLCASSCPESAISLSARLVTDANQRNLMRTLHEDEPFCCIRCQKPFATHSVIARISEKMKHHPMFSGDALERLKMCEDCRVKDIYETKNDASPDVHPGGHA